MPYLKMLLDRFDSDEGNPLRRAIDALDMIEFAITFPACDTITKKEIEEIEVRIKKVHTELKDNPVLARRIEKWWNKRETCQYTAKSLHKPGHNHLASLHYHERILGIRKARAELIKRLEGEELSLEEHGLFGSKYPHSLVHH